MEGVLDSTDELLGKFLNIPVVHTFHGFHYEDLSPLMRWLHLATETFLTLLTDQHIFVSTGEKNRARVVKFLDEENSTTIHNGVDHEYIRDLSAIRKTVSNLLDAKTGKIIKF